MDRNKIKIMEAEEIRLRALLHIKTGNEKYIKDVPQHLQFAGLYPETQKTSMIEKVLEERALEILKKRIDRE